MTKALWTWTLGFSGALLLLLSLTGCADSAPANTGRVVLALQGDMSFPDDLDTLRLQATIAGETVADEHYDIAPTGRTQLPVTLELGEGFGPRSEVTATLLGLSKGRTLTLARAQTTLPEHGKRLLHLAAQWLCREPLEGTDPKTTRGQCRDDETCVAGKCASARIDVASLLETDGSGILGDGSEDGGTNTCFPTVECFAGGVDLAVGGDCTVELNVPTEGAPNFGLVMAPGQGGIGEGEGEGEGEHYIPLNEGQLGWLRLTRRGATRVKAQLPTAVCDELKAGTVVAVRGTATCPTKTLALPTCGPWSSVDDKVEVAVLHNAPPPEEPRDAATPTDAGAPGDAAIPGDASAPASPTDPPPPTLIIEFPTGEAPENLPPGASIQLEIPGIPPADAAWTSDDEAVATVSKDGVLTTHAPGTAIIRVTSSAGSGTVLITVADSGLGVVIRSKLVELTIVFDGTGQSSLLVDETLQLRASGTYTNGDVRDVTAQATWSSSASDALEFTSPGNILGLSPGTALVRAELDGVATSLVVSVGEAAEPSADAGSTPRPIPVALTASGLNGPLWPGESASLIAQATYDDDSVRMVTTDVAWRSDNESVVRVSAGGIVSALSVGTSTIHGTWNNLSLALEVDVVAAELVTLTLAPIEPLPAGLGEQLLVVGSYGDDTEQPLTSGLSWNSSDEGVATVSPTGLLTGINPGAVTVEVVDEASGLSDAIDVIVTDVVPVKLSIPAIEAVPAGMSTSLEALMTLSDGSERVAPHGGETGVQWSSGDTTVVSVTSAGSAKALIPGTAKVVATLGDLYADAEFQVTSAIPVALTLSPARAQMAVGDKLSLTAQGSYSDGSTEDVGKAATWTTADDTLASVSAGVVTAVKPGATSVTASWNGFVAKSELTVEQAPSPFELLMVDDSGMHQPSRPYQYQSVRYALVQTRSNTVVASTLKVEGGELLSSNQGIHTVRFNAQSASLVVGYQSETYVLDVQPLPAQKLHFATDGSLIPVAWTVPWGTRYSPQFVFEYEDATHHTAPSDLSVTLSVVGAGYAAGVVAFDEAASARLQASFGNLSTTTDVTVEAVALALDLVLRDPSETLLPPEATFPVGTILEVSVRASLRNEPARDVTAQARWTPQDAVEGVAGAPPLARLRLATAGSKTFAVAWGGIERSYTVTATAPTPPQVVVTPSLLVAEVGTDAAFRAQLKSDNGSVDITDDATWPTIPGLTMGAPGSYRIGLATTLQDYPITVKYEKAPSTPATATLRVVARQPQLLIVNKDDGAPGPLAVDAGETWHLLLVNNDQSIRIPASKATWSVSDGITFEGRSGHAVGRSVGDWVISATYTSDAGPLVAQATVKVEPTWRFSPDISQLPMKGSTTISSATMLVAPGVAVEAHVLSAQGQVSLSPDDDRTLLTQDAGSGSVTFEATYNTKVYTYLQPVTVLPIQLAATEPSTSPGSVIP